MLTDFDLHLFGEGRHWKSYEKLGAQLETHDGVRGVNFAVWAPNAEGVSVVGDFNGWNGSSHRLQKRIPSGVWELFVPGLAAGTIYKYRVSEEVGHSDRTDPYGFGAEVPPRTASQVIDLAAYQWQDGDWMATRAGRNALSAPMSIYEIHLGSWRRPGDDTHRWLSYADLERELV
ncbi:MAG: 1,4-alpha-glucan branching enzyme, partial [Pirellulales bacterium]